MKPKTYWALGVLVVLLICACVYLFKTYINSAPALLRRPPLGETYTTGHWEGDVWRRTVPPDPEKILISGVWMTYEDIKRAYDHNQYNPSQRDVYRKHAIEKYPYSEEAFTERLYRAEHDENSKELVNLIWDKDILVPRYKAMLKWHLDSPCLLQKLAALLEEDSPEEAIKYGEAALKYTHLYPGDSAYGEYPEEIHRTLGIAYQRGADYDAALVHLKAAVKLMETYPDRTIWDVDIYRGWIERIHAGTPRFGPPDPDFEYESDDFSGIDVKGIIDDNDVLDFE